MQKTQRSEATESDMKYSEKHIEIPNDRKIIVIRANIGEKSPVYFRSDWSKLGSIESNIGRGLFGVMLTQQFNYIYQISYYTINPTYQILEVDKRDFLYSDDLANQFEVEFKRCNVLFNGDLFSFKIEIEKYATQEQFQRLFSMLDYKIEEITFSNLSDVNRIEYVFEILRRAEEGYNKYSTK